MPPGQRVKSSRRATDALRLAACLLALLSSAACGPPAPVSPATRALPTPAPAQPSPAELRRAALVVDGESTRLLLSGSRPLSPSLLLREDGLRVVVDLPDTVMASKSEPPSFPEGARTRLSKIEARSLVELGHPHVRIEADFEAPVEARLAQGEDPETVVLVLVPRGLPLPGEAAAPPPAARKPPSRTRTPGSPGAGVPSFVSADWRGRPPVFVVHFYSSREKTAAEKEAVRLAKAVGQPARAIAVDLGEKGTWYRVVAGEFQTYDEAAAWKKGLAGKLASEARFVYRLSGG